MWGKGYGVKRMEGGGGSDFEMEGEGVVVYMGVLGVEGGWLGVGVEVGGMM